MLEKREETAARRTDRQGTFRRPPTGLTQRDAVVVVDETNGLVVQWRVVVMCLCGEERDADDRVLMIRVMMQMMGSKRLVEWIASCYHAVSKGSEEYHCCYHCWCYCLERDAVYVLILLGFSHQFVLSPPSDWKKMVMGNSSSNSSLEFDRRSLRDLNREMVMRMRRCFDFAHWTFRCCNLCCRQDCYCSFH